MPLIEGIAEPPGSDALKHFGAALASYGSVALFHMPGITAEDDADARRPAGTPIPEITPRRDRGLSSHSYGATGDKVDVVVFAAPQLSLIEMAEVADALDGRQVHPDTTLLVATSPEIKYAADRMGLTARIEASGAIVAAGICFYQSYAGEMAEANGWKRLLTNSAKLVNIIGGYGYRPTLASLERCVDSAVAGTDRLMPIMLRCHPGIGPAVTGTALVAKDNFSARYDLDRKAGVFSRPTHALAGQSYTGRILVLDEAKGGVATAWMLHEMKSRGIVPLALVFNRVNPILAQGAAFGAVTMVDRFADGDVTDLIRTGDTLRIDPSGGNWSKILNAAARCGLALADSIRMRKENRALATRRIASRAKLRTAMRRSMWVRTARRFAGCRSAAVDPDWSTVERAELRLAPGQSLMRHCRWPGDYGKPRPAAVHRTVGQHPGNCSADHQPIWSMHRLESRLAKAATMSSSDCGRRDTRRTVFRLCILQAVQLLLG